MTPTPPTPIIFHHPQPPQEPRPKGSSLSAVGPVQPLARLKVFYEIKDNKEAWQKILSERGLAFCAHNLEELNAMLAQGIEDIFVPLADPLPPEAAEVRLQCLQSLARLLLPLTWLNPGDDAEGPIRLKAEAAYDLVATEIIDQEKTVGNAIDIEDEPAALLRNLFFPKPPADDLLLQLSKVAVDLQRQIPDRPEGFLTKEQQDLKRLQEKLHNVQQEMIGFELQLKRGNRLNLAQLTRLRRDIEAYQVHLSTKNTRTANEAVADGELMALLGMPIFQALNAPMKAITEREPNYILHRTYDRAEYAYKLIAENLPENLSISVNKAPYAVESAEASHALLYQYHVADIAQHMPNPDFNVKVSNTGTTFEQTGNNNDPSVYVKAAVTWAIGHSSPEKPVPFVLSAFSEQEARDIAELIYLETLRQGRTLDTCPMKITEINHRGADNTVVTKKPGFFESGNFNTIIKAAKAAATEKFATEAPVQHGRRPSV